MNASKTFGSVLIASLATTVLFASSGDQVLELTTILSATFQGSTPGNDLRLDLWPVANSDPSHHDLFLQVTGKYQGQVVRRQGLMRFEGQGKGVYVGYIPHFDPAVTALSSNAAVFTDEESDAACGFDLSRRGDGFAGETPGTSCAFALRGATGKWSVELEPGSIRLREVRTGETLRFKRIEKH